MKRNFIQSIAIMIVMMFSSMTVYAGDACQGINLELLQKHAPIPKAEIVSMKEVHGLCEVILKVGSDPVPVYAAKDFIIAGEMFSDRSQVTRETLDVVRNEIDERTKGMFKSLEPKMKEAAAITYRPEGEVKHTVYMFSSPGCPYCKRASEQIKDVMDETNSELVILLEGNGNTKSESVKAVCKNVDLDTYNAGTWKEDNAGESSLCVNGVKVVGAAYELAHTLN